MWDWTMMILQPDQLDDDVLEQATAKAGKKGLAALACVRLERFAEGRAVQVLHRGLYSAEGPMIAALHAFIAAHGLELAGKHHEIYLSDPAARRWRRSRRSCDSRCGEQRPGQARALPRHGAARRRRGVRGGARRVGGLLVASDADAPGARLFIAAFGARNVLLGAGTLAALPRARPARPWLAACVAADAFDALATVRSFAELPARRRVVTFVVSASPALIGAGLARRLNG